MDAGVKMTENSKVWKELLSTPEETFWLRTEKTIVFKYFNFSVFVAKLTQFIFILIKFGQRKARMNWTEDYCPALEIS